MNRTRIRDNAARAALRVAQRQSPRVKFDYSNAANNSSAVTVDGYLKSGRRSQGILGGKTDFEELTIMVPRQTGFPPTAGLLNGATVKYPTSTGTVYAVLESIPQGGSVENSATFILRLGRHSIEPIGRAHV